MITKHAATLHYNTHFTGNPDETEHTVVIEATVHEYGDRIRAAVRLDGNGSPIDDAPAFSYEGVDNVEMAVRKYLDAHGETDAPSFAGLLESAIVDEAVAVYHREENETMIDSDLTQAIEDWFLNSPSWPFPVDVDKETDDYMRDGCKWTKPEVRAAIQAFADEQE